MLDKLIALLRGDTSEGDTGRDEVQHAVAALLIEAAWRDDVFDPAERTAIIRLLSERFAISAEAAEGLVKTVSESRSSQLFGFTSKIVKAMEGSERVRLIEMLWEVAYADGVLDPQEDQLIRRVAGLIYVSDQDRGAARRRVRAKLGLL